MTTISLVLGYGIYLPSNTAYFDRYFSYIIPALQSALPDYIITTGGHTNSQHLDLSEAETIRDLLIEKLPGYDPSHIIAESESFTSLDNLLKSQQLISTLPGDQKQLTIYCDSCRVPKIAYLSLGIFQPAVPATEKDHLEQFISLILTDKTPDYSQRLTLSHPSFTLEGIPLSSEPSHFANQALSSMLEMHYLDYPDLHQRFISWRKKQWGIK